MDMVKLLIDNTVRLGQYREATPDLLYKEGTAHDVHSTSSPHSWLLLLLIIILMMILVITLVNVVILWWVMLVVVVVVVGIVSYFSLSRYFCF